MAGIKFDITGDNSNVLGSFNGVQQGVRRMASAVEESGKSIENMFDRIKSAASVALAGFSVKEFAKKVTEVRGQFQQLEIAFSTMLQSEEKADALMSQLVKTAAITPFDLKGIAEGAKQLMAYGTAAEDVNDIIVRLGDIAAGMSIPLNDLVYLYGTTMTQGRMFTMDLRQFMGRGIPIAEEIAKIFGVAKNEVADLVTQGKVTDQIFKQAIENMTNEGSKFGGLMDAQSKTITGQISNIEDAIDMMFNDLGKQSEGVINDVLSGVSYLVEHYETVGKTILTVAVAYGTYKAALLAVIAAQKLATIWGAVQAFFSLAKSITSAKDAMLLLNIATKANPYGLILSVVTATAAAIYMFASSESAAEKATRLANEALEEQNKINDERRNKVQELLRTIQDKNATELAQIAAYNELKTLVPDITEKYSQEQLAALGAAEGQKELNESVEKLELGEKTKELEKWERVLNSIKNAGGDWSKLEGGVEGEIADLIREKYGYGLLNNKETDIQTYVNELRRQVDGINRMMAEAAEKARPIELRIQEARENVDVKQEIFDFYTQAKDLTDHWQLANEQIDFVTAKTRLETFIEESEADLENMRQKVEDNPMDVNLRMAYEEKKKILDGLKDIKSNAEQNGNNRMDFMLDMKWNINYTSLQQQLQNAITKLNGLTATTVEGGATSLEAEYNAAKTRYENAKRALANIDANRSKYTKEDRIAAQSELSTAKDAFGALGGDVSNTKNKDKQAANERAQRIKQEAKYQELLRKQKLDRERTAKDMEFSTTQATIDAMEEGSQKTLAQIKLDFKKQKEEIERGYIDLKQKKIDEARQLWEANPANKGKTFDESTVDTEYTDAEVLLHSKQLQAATEEYNRSMEDAYRNEAQALRDYLKEYGTFQEQKLALAKEYAEKIKKAQSNGERLTLQSEYEAKSNEIDTNRLISNIDMASVFGDFGMLLTEPLKQTVEQLRRLTQTDAFKNRSFEEQKTVFDAIEKAEHSLSGLYSLDFQGIGDSMVVYNAALAERVRLEGELARAAESLADADAKLTRARATGKDAAIALAQGEYNEAEAKYNILKNDYAAASTRAAEAQSRTTKSLTQFKDTLDRIDSSVRQIYNGSLKGIWDILGTKLQNKIGSVVSGGAALQNQFDNLVKSLTRSGSTLDDFAGQLQSRLGEVFSSFTDETTLEDAKNAVNRMITTVFKESFGEDDKYDKVASRIGTLIGDLLEQGTEEGTAKDTAQSIGQTIGELLKNVGKAGEASGNLWGAIIGIVLQLLDEFAENGLGRFVNTLLQNVGNAVDGILGNLFQDLIPQLLQGVGGLVAGVVEGVVNMVSFGAAGSFLTGKDHEEEYAKTLEDWKSKIETNTYAVEQLTEKMTDKSLTPQEAQAERDAALSALQGQIASARGTADYIAGDSSSNWFSGYHSWYYKRNNKRFDYSRFNNALAEHGSNTRVYSAQDVVRLSPEDIQILRTYVGEAWADYFSDVDSKKNPNDVKEYLEQIGDLAEKDKEIMNEWYASLTNMSFDSLRSNFKSTLMDMEKDSDDFLDDFAEMMMDSLMDSMMSTSGLSAALEEWQKKWGEAIASGNELSAEEVEELRKEYEALIQQGIDLRNEAARVTGYGENDPYEQDASSGGWQSMGQDTADELNGRFTALQISGEQIREGVTTMVTTLAALSALADGRNLTLIEIRNLMITNNAFLEDILEANKKSYEKFEKQLDKIVNQTK